MYTVTIVGYLYNSGTLQDTKYYDLQFNIKAPFVTNTPPYFVSSLDYIVLSPGFDFSYSLPDSKDN